MVYVPGKRLAKLYAPASFESAVVDDSRRIIRRLDFDSRQHRAVASLTVPLTRALLDWPNAWVARQTHSNTDVSKTRFIDPPELVPSHLRPEGREGRSFTTSSTGLPEAYHFANGATRI